MTHSCCSMSHRTGAPVKKSVNSGANMRQRTPPLGCSGILVEMGDYNVVVEMRVDKESFSLHEKVKN